MILNIQKGTTRFNEWDPFASSRQQQQQQERQKSPLKSKQQQGQAQSTFTHTFLMAQDASPRQASGRVNSSATHHQKYQPPHHLATMTTFQQQLQQQQQQQQSQFLLINPLGVDGSNAATSTSNLDLMVSGQKLLGPSPVRKESPTNMNTPRESMYHQYQQQQLQRQESSANQHRSYLRRLQPIDKNSSSDPAPSALNNSSEGQVFGQKTGYLYLRIKGQFVSYQNTKIKSFKLNELKNN